MIIEFNRPTIYMSHSIQGDDGDIFGNCDRAKKAVYRLRKVFPEVKWYCPGEINLVVDVLHRLKFVTNKQILEADCEILKNCNNWFWWYTSPSKGCEIEMNVAKECGFIPESSIYHNVVKDDLLKCNFGNIRKRFTPIVDVASMGFPKGWEQELLCN